MSRSPKPSSEPRSHSWVQTFRQLVRATYGPGWILREHRGGRTQVTRAWGDGSRSSITVPLAWTPESCPALLVLVERLDLTLRSQAMSLSKAIELIDFEDGALSPRQLSRGITSWQSAAERFRFHMVEESGTVSARTWHVSYRRHLQEALLLLERPKSPRDGLGLLQAIALAYPTPPGGTGRRQRLGNIARFLNFAVNHCGKPEQYLPPLDYRNLIGKRLTRKGPGTPVLDHQFLDLYKAIDDSRWRLAIGLLGVFGLRPAELEACRPDQHGLRVEGVKRNSSGCSAPRLVHGLDPAGGEGLADALLDECRRKGEHALPGAVVAAYWSTRIQQHLVRHVPRWHELLATARAEGQGHITVYGLRHGFAFRGSQLYELTPRVLAALMGHTTSVHLRHYGQWVGDQEIALAVSAARQRFMA